MSLVSTAWWRGGASDGNGKAARTAALGDASAASTHADWPCSTATCSTLRRVRTSRAQASRSLAWRRRAERAPERPAAAATCRAAGREGVVGCVRLQGCERVFTGDGRGGCVYGNLQTVGCEACEALQRRRR